MGSFISNCAFPRFEYPRQNPADDEPVYDDCKASLRANFRCSNRPFDACYGSFLTTKSSIVLYDENVKVMDYGGLGSRE